MKYAVEQQLTSQCYTRTETEVGRGYRDSGYLRVDVKYRKYNRDHLVECETKPNIKRLIGKAEKRHMLGYRNSYLLIIPSEEYPKYDWSRLKGYYDMIYTYSEGTLRLRRDYRRLGFLQDTVMGLIMPVVESRWVRRLVTELTALASVSWDLKICPMCMLKKPLRGVTCRELYCPLHGKRWVQIWEFSKYYYLPH